MFNRFKHLPDILAKIIGILIRLTLKVKHYTFRKLSHSISFGQRFFVVDGNFNTCGNFADTIFLQRIG